MAAMGQEFDRFSESYRRDMEEAMAFCTRDHDYFVQAKAHHLVTLAQAFLGPPAGLRALDVGCGMGFVEVLLAPQFSRVAGVDIAEDEIQHARHAAPQASFSVYDGEKLPFGDGEFDLVFCINVFHHILPDRRPAMLQEMKRVIRSGGLAVLFEHNPWNPLTRLVVARCAFDRNASLLTRRCARRLLEQGGFQRIRQSYILFLPFRSRASHRLDRRLGWLPLGAQYYVAGVK